MTYRSFETLNDDLQRGLVAIDDVVIELADQDRESDIVTLLAARARLDREAAANALGADTDAPVGLVCRAAGVRLNGYSAILRMRHRRGQGERASPSALLRAYQQALEQA
ncbi:MAG: hypothetical protein AB7O60_16680 [Variibacter sp.]